MNCNPVIEIIRPHKHSANREVARSGRIAVEKFCKKRNVTKLDRPEPEFAGGGICDRLIIVMS